MRRWISKIFILTFVLVLASGLFSLLRFFKNPGLLYDPLAAQIEEPLGARLSLQNWRIAFFPFPALRGEKLRLESVTDGFPPLTAEQVRVSFQSLPLLWGKVRLSGFQIREGKGTFGGISLEQIQFKIKRLNRKGFAPFEGKAGLAGGKEVFKGKGGVSFQHSRGNLWTDLGLRADITMNPFSFREETGKGLWKPFLSGPFAGELRGSLRLNKEKGKDEFKGGLRFQVKDFRSGGAGAFSLAGQAGLLWNPRKASVELQEASLKSPFGEIGGTGVFNVETGEVEEARLTGRKIILEELVRHFPNLHSALPLDIGFSGETEFDLTLRGTWDHLSLHVNWNLTPAVLTYGKIFSKPKDFPLGMSTDFLLKRGSRLSGDFSVRIHETTLKGTLARFDLKTGEGEFTLLSNKFDLAGWEKLLIPFAPYQISGSAKVFLNLKGKLGELKKAQKMANLTLENGSFLSRSGRGIREAQMRVDFSPLNVRIKEASFKLGRSRIQLEAEIYNFEKAPQGKLKVSSPRLNLPASLENLQAFRFLSENPSLLKAIKMEQELNRFLPPPFVLEGLTLHLEVQPKKLALEDLEFQAWEGSLHLKGESDWPSEKPNFWLEVAIDRIALARYFQALHPTEEILEGNFFFTGRFEGQGWKPEEIREKLTGQGSLSITNGEWHPLNLVKSLTHLEPFQTLASQPVRSTPFSDFKATWSYGKGKFDAHDLLILSEDLWMKGEGSLSLEGALNARLEGYLSKPLTEQVLNAWGVREKAEGKQLGPIPFLLLGSLEKPESRADERRIETFLEAVRARRFRKILHEPFKE